MIIRIVIFIPEHGLRVVLPVQSATLLLLRHPFTGCTLSLVRLLKDACHWFSIRCKCAKVGFLTIHRLGYVDWSMLADVDWCISNGALLETRLIIAIFVSEGLLDLLALTIHFIALERLRLNSTTHDVRLLLCSWQFHLRQAPPRLGALVLWNLLLLKFIKDVVSFSSGKLFALSRLLHLVKHELQLFKTDFFDQVYFDILVADL